MKSFREYMTEELGMSNFRKLSDKERKELYSLTNLALRQVPQSSKQKETIKKINVLRKKAGLELIKEGADLVEDKVTAALKKKSKKTGVDMGTLRKIFNRGVAAWRTGHTPGTNPTQWGLARVNSVLTGGPARKSDADLWSKRKKVAK
jgi:hypothetical protein